MGSTLYRHVLAMYDIDFDCLLVLSVVSCGDRKHLHILYRNVHLLLLLLLLFLLLLLLSFIGVKCCNWKPEFCSTCC